jgi:hypothetical protein
MSETTDPGAEKFSKENHHGVCPNKKATATLRQKYGRIGEAGAKIVVR